MKDIMEYQPYGVYKYMGYFWCFLYTVFILLFVIFFESWDLDDLFYGGMMIISFKILIKHSFNEAKKIIYFEEKGIRLINDRRNVHQFIDWENMKYGYYCTNYRGYWFLLLSQDEIEKHKIKKIVNNATFSLFKKMFYKDIVVIYVYQIEKMPTVIKCMIENKIQFVNCENGL